MSAPFKKIKSNNMSESKTSSWVEYGPDSEFPIQNLPWGAFQIPSGETHVGVAIGDKVLDVTALANEGLFNDSKHLQGGDVFKQSTLNAFMGLGRAAWTEARSLLSLWLSADNGTIRDNSSLLSLSLLSQSDVKMVLPAQIGDYTDFYASRYHATNVGIMFRGKDNALQPNWLHLPVGYHGRASSVVVSGTDMKRPNGQLRPDLEKPPVFGSCKLLDFELEMGYFVGPSNDMGTPISIENASDHIFGVVLMNDWSARDIQKWEYVPLGPFNGKNFGTTISPWIVTLDALAPFTTEAEEQVPEVLPYLSSPSRAMFDISLSVSIQAEGESDESVVSTSNAKYLYWTPQQMLTHHTSTGCPMRPGDLFGSGTISGPEEHEYGSMLELCWKGTREVELKNGGKRKFLKDGDTVKMRGFCQGEGYRVGFGSCDGKVIPANKLE